MRRRLDSTVLERRRGAAVALKRILDDAPNFLGEVANRNVRFVESELGQFSTLILVVIPNIFSGELFYLQRKVGAIC